MLTDQEGFSIVLKYFGIKAVASTKAKQPVDEPKSKINFNVNLEDLF